MQAFGLLVSKYQNRIYNLILRMCSSPSDAEELAQETFLRAMENIGQFRNHSRFYTWLFRIAANLVISHRRRSNKVTFRSLTSGEEYDTRRADGLTATLAQRRVPGPVAAAMAAEIGERIDQALDELGEDFRIVVILRDIEQIDYAEISEILDLPIGTVKSRLHRARCMLKKSLADLVG